MDTSERLQQMIGFYEHGMSMDDIGKVYGITRQAVSSLFKRHGIDISGSRELVMGIQDAYGLYQSGMSSNEVADLMGVHHGWLLGWFQEYGFDVDVRDKKWTYQKTLAMYQDYCSGLTMRELTGKYATDQSRISKLFKLYGFPSRRKWTQKM